MRQIKFRKWDFESKEMIDGDSLAFEEYLPICQHLTQDGIMQYTGLQDKNGKEIYEGDILKQTYHAVTGSYDDQISFDGYHIGAVVITASQGVCMKKPLCYSEETDETTVSNQYKKVAGYRCEVIGNIYENKELLQVA